MSWQEELLARLRLRNAVQTRIFEEIVGSHTSLQLGSRELQARIAQLEKDLIIAQHGSSDGAASSEKVQKLESRIKQLQSELTEQYKAKAATASASLELSTEARESQRAAHEMRSALALSQAEVARLSAQCTEQQKELGSQGADLSTLRGEIVRLREKLDQTEKSVRELTSENQMLVQRMLDEKERMVTEMNRMNSLVEEGNRAGRGSGVSGTGSGSTSEGQGAPAAAGGTWAARHAGSVQPPRETQFMIAAHATEVPALCFSDNGALIATGSSDGTVKLWGSDSGRHTGTLHPTSSGAGGITASRNPVMSVHIRGDIHELTGHTGKIYATRLSPDGRLAYTGSTDRKVMVWDLNSGYKVRTVSTPSICNALDVNDDGTLLATAHQDTSVRLWDMRTWQLAAVNDTAHDAAATSVCFSRGGARHRSGATLLTNSRDNSLWMLDVNHSLSPLKQLKHEAYRAAFNWSRSVLSPDTAWAAAGTADGSLFVWNALTGDHHAVLSGAHSVAIAAVAWHPTGKQVATCDKKGSLVIWSA